MYFYFSNVKTMLELPKTKNIFFNLTIYRYVSYQCRIQYVYPIQTHNLRSVFVALKIIIHAFRSTT